ncbi:hypothetical protein J6590_013847 [Homalodisca vitripennis]|nr:hypothetical protein J6590_013847 [Homalodisca vitripennis]
MTRGTNKTVIKLAAHRIVIIDTCEKLHSPVQGKRIAVIDTARPVLATRVQQHSQQHYFNPVGRSALSLYKIVRFQTCIVGPNIGSAARKLSVWLVNFVLYEILEWAGYVDECSPDVYWQYECLNCCTPAITKYRMLCDLGEEVFSLSHQEHNLHYDVLDRTGFEIPVGGQSLSDDYESTCRCRVACGEDILSELLIRLYATTYGSLVTCSCVSLSGADPSRVLLVRRGGVDVIKTSSKRELPLITAQAKSHCFHLSIICSRRYEWETKRAKGRAGAIVPKEFYSHFCRVSLRAPFIKKIFTKVSKPLFKETLQQGGHRDESTTFVVFVPPLPRNVIYSQVSALLCLPHIVPQQEPLYSRHYAVYDVPAVLLLSYFSLCDGSSTCIVLMS